MTDPLAAVSTVVTLHTFGALLNELRALQGWSFRGQRDSEWTLETSLERSGSIDAVSDERDMLNRFQRGAKARLPSQLIPGNGDILGWWSIMQHYGAPTRMVDFSRSPYVALFFAFEHYADVESRTLWSVNVAECQRRAVEVLATDEAQKPSLLRWLVNDQQHLIRTLIGGESPLCAFVVEPWEFDDRQEAQQTQFLVPSRTDHSLVANLQALGPCPGMIRRLTIPNELRPTILEELIRMNVTAASLFPGLDGFARSMRTQLTIETPSQRTFRWARDGVPLEISEENEQEADA